MIDKLKEGMPLHTKHPDRNTNAFVYSITDEFVTVISDWGNMAILTHEELEKNYSLIPNIDFYADYSWESPEQRLKEQIDKLRDTLNRITK